MKRDSACRKPSIWEVRLARDDRLTSADRFKPEIEDQLLRR